MSPTEPPCPRSELSVLSAALAEKEAAVKLPQGEHGGEVSVHPSYSSPSTVTHERKHERKVMKSRDEAVAERWV